MRCNLRNCAWLLAGVLVLALPAWGQLQYGDNLRMNMGGDLSTGYNGSYGNTGTSAHGINVGGDLSLNGSYFDPKFISFNVGPYYNRSQANSAFQSITDTSGLNSTVNFFGGSNFPGYVNFSRSYNSTGQFGIPGVNTLTTHGDTRGFGIGWSALLPDLPTISASFTSSGSSSSIFGSDATTDSTLHTLALRSGYLLHGFRLNGTFLHQTSEGDFPAQLTGATEAFSSRSSANNYLITASHSFPLHGSFSTSASRLNYHYDSTLGSPSSGTSDGLNANLNFHPTEKLALSFNSNYNDNLIALLPQELVTAGTVAPSSATFHSVLFSADGYYQLRPTLSVHGIVSRQNQYFQGQSYGATQVGGNLNYVFTHRLLGSLTFSGGVIDNANKEGNTALGFYGNVNFLRKFNRWDLSGAFNYSQNVETLLTVYTTSSYSYLASVTRKIGDRLHWSGSFSGGHTAFVQTAGSGSQSERASSSITYRRYALAGYWSTSTGTAVLTSTGLVPVEGSIPAALLGLQGITLYNAKAWGASMSASPLSRLTLTGSYSHANGSSQSPLINTSNQTRVVNMLMRYRFRKLFFDAGFTRFRQGVTTLDIRNPGAPIAPPGMVSSYYFGISRWFNFF
jgi:hypothetical protein